MNRDPVRIVLEGERGESLTVVLEYIGPFRKLFAEHRLASGEMRVSTPKFWEGDTLDHLHEDKVKDAERIGWKRRV